MRTILYSILIFAGLVLGGVTSVDQIRYKIEESRIEKKHMGEIRIIQAGTGHGTGFFISPNMLVTNYHVVAKSSGFFTAATAKIGDSVYIVDSQNRFSKGIIYKVSEKHDLALIKTNTSSIFTVTVDVRDVKMGEELYVVGNGGSDFFDAEFGKAQFDYYISGGGNDIIYNGASIPVRGGHSGSPVYSEAGRVIGVVSRGGGGYCLFIPIKYVIDLIHAPEQKPQEEEKSE